MNRYQKESAIHRIDGHYFPEPHELALGKLGDAFDRAKAETIKQMRLSIAETEAINEAVFFSSRR